MKEGQDFSLLTDYLERQLALTPLEVMARACLDPTVNAATVHKIFDSYDQYLALLDDPSKRAQLGEARTHDDLRNSMVWTEVRDLSRPFHQGLVDLFLKDNEELRNLAMTYGIF